MSVSPQFKLDQFVAFQEALREAMEAQNEIDAIGLISPESKDQFRIGELIVQQDQAYERLLTAAAHLIAADVFKNVQQALTLNVRDVA